MSDTPQSRATTVEDLVTMMRKCTGGGAMEIVPFGPDGKPIFMVLIVEGKEVERYRAKLAELDDEP